jgi:hypothetical protein
MLSVRRNGDDRAQRQRRVRPFPVSKADAHPRRVAAHERNEQSPETQETDTVDIAGQRAERAGQATLRRELSIAWSGHAARAQSDGFTRIPQAFHS